MTGRPKGTIEVWASQDTWPIDPEVDWSGADTKTDPGSGIVSLGHLPGFRIPANWENFVKNQLTAHLKFLDAIHALNFQPWFQVGVPDPAYHLFVSDPLLRVTWVALYRVFALEPKVFVAYDGVTMIDAAYPGTLPITGMAMAPQGYMWVTAQGDSGTQTWYYRDNSNGTGDGFWIDFELDGSTATSSGTSAVLFNQYDQDGFQAFGSDENNYPAVWHMFNSGADAQAQVLPNFDDHGTGGCILMACGANRKIVIANVVDGYWQWDAPAESDIMTGLSTWTDRGETPFASAPVSLVWSAEDEIFLVVCSAGQCYISADDGVNWVLARGSDATQQFMHMTNHGSLYLASLFDDTQFNATATTVYLACSTNRGATWTRLALPLEQLFDMGTNVTAARVNLLDNGFAIFSATADRVCYSLRTR